MIIIHTAWKTIIPSPFLSPTKKTPEKSTQNRCPCILQPAWLKQSLPYRVADVRSTRPATLGPNGHCVR